MKALVIGYGSIGKRHSDVLEKLGFEVDIVSRQKLSQKSFQSLKEVENLNEYNYYLIASETFKHYEQLKFLEQNLKDKIIFCEKPVFEKYMKFNIKNNLVYVGYVLRFHPLINKLKKLIENEKIYFVEVNCNSYLPNWRKDSDYKSSYSAFKEKGGGVLLDLSHEIDYVIWLFGNFIEINSFQSKISELSINSDDLVILNGKTSRDIRVSLTIGYFSKLSKRDITIHTENKTLHIDLIKNSLITTDIKGVEEIYTISNINRDFIFEEMHKDILNTQELSCNFDEAIKVMEVIDKIQEQNGYGIFNKN